MCPNEDCEGPIRVRFWPGLPGNTYGPIERCYPPEPPGLDAPSECPGCGLEITDDQINRWLEDLEVETDW